MHQQHQNQSNSAPLEELAFPRADFRQQEQRDILLQVMAQGPAGTKYLSVLLELANTVNASLVK